MSRATEDQLASLHKRVAEAFIGALNQSEFASALLDKERDVPLPADVVDFLEELQTVNPSLLTAATKFLKDNNISADPSENSDLKELQDSLNAKRKAGKVLSIPTRD